MATASQSHHEPGAGLYWGVFGALCVLTLLTIGVYQVHLGAWNLIVAIMIATLKAALVVWFFMHMSHESRFNALIFLSSLLFGAIFLAYTLNDTGRRTEVDGYHGAVFDPSTGGLAHGAPAEMAPAEEDAEAESSDTPEAPDAAQ